MLEFSGVDGSPVDHDPNTTGVQAAFASGGGLDGPSYLAFVRAARDCDADGGLDTCQSDGDGDGVADACDLCPQAADANQWDDDYDGVSDACDQCPGTPSGLHVTSFGCATARADFDEDLDVDLEDFAHVQACVTGPGQPQIDPACQNARLDGDSDVDLEDGTIVVLCMSGPGVPSDPHCGE